MTIRRHSPRKRALVMDSDDEGVFLFRAFEVRTTDAQLLDDLLLRASPSTRPKDELDQTSRQQRILTPSTSEDEGISYRSPWTQLSHINIPPLTCPKSSYLGWQSSTEEMSEEDALQDLLVSFQTIQSASSLT